MQIPLPVLLTVIVLGVGLVVVLSWAVGWSAEAELKGPGDALRHWEATHPEHPAATALVDDRRRAALLELEDESVGLVFVHGDQLVARHLAPGALRGVSLTGTTLTLALAGHARPAVTVQLDDPQRRSAWHARLAHRT